MTDTGAGKIRIDKWLWYTRCVKSRSLAQSTIKSGKVRVNGTRVSSPSSTISVGDVLTITLDRQIKIFKVQAPGTRRGPAPEARLLYEDLSPPPPKKEEIVWTNTVAVRDEGAGRPTKKQRRETTRFREKAAKSDFEDE